MRRCAFMNTELLKQAARRGLITGTIASALSTSALAALGARNLKRPAAMTNATSHWLWGDAAFRAHEPSLKHTGVGYLTHHASAVFWASIFQYWLGRSKPRRASQIVRDAAVMTAVAGLVDYGLTPRRLRPGFEQHLSRSSLLGVFATIGIGLAAGALLQQRR